MSEITHATLANYAVDRVNLPSTDAQKYREQVRNMREQVE